ncbi:hydroxymethylglutaryl-CoA lyase [Streptomyces sp. NBC_00335]|uniref:hydroxymethylglutaryl-CoA lyase n=1 Tax=unclassified Streptomyces TaxID=2593676 RepID=UPI0022541ABA|nr:MULTISPECIES: hydroxymethylglutaryl-CoA lyase [unclassified Streptomyces]MCX5410211.1 hydroxymethylglutaryl-CoA lyase [Streptomyces sp. NBC_00086]
MDNPLAAVPLTGPGVVEVAPRDGLQNEARALSPAQRVALIERAVAAGARRVEAVAFVHPDRVPQMAGAEEVMSLLRRPDGVRYSGLVLNARGMDRACASGVDEVNYVVVASDSFSRRNQGVGTREALAAWEGIASRAHTEGIGRSLTIAAAFGCPFEGETPQATVAELARIGVETGAEEIVLADTIGVGAPDAVTRLLDAVREQNPGVALRCHFHNTRNTGYANAVAAAAAGAAWLDSSLGGIGGCPFAPAATGNIATEDLVYLLRRMGLEPGIDLESAAATGTWLGTVLGIEVPALLGRAGPFPASGRTGDRGEE